MEKNVGDIDGALRIVAGIVLAVIYTGFAGISVAYPLSLVVLALALIMLITGIFGFCPIYKLLGMNTNEAGKTPKPKAAEEEKKTKPKAKKK